MQRRNFLAEVDRGRLGKNRGLPNVFQRFNTYLHNTQKGKYYAVGGLPGGGKSTFIDDNFILTPYFYYRLNKVTPKIIWLYYSFEMSYFEKRSKWTSYYLSKKYNLEVDPNYILSKGKNRISDDIYQKVVEVDQEMDMLFSHVKMCDDNENPTGIRNTAIKLAKQLGTIYYKTIINDQGKPVKIITGYKPHNPDWTVEVIVDHVALTATERGFNTKQNIDKLSEYFIFLRNKFNWTTIASCQFHRGLTAVERQKFKGVDLAPTLEDFKDTGNIGQDCNIALGLFNPHKFDLQTYLGYPISDNNKIYPGGGFKNNFRAVNIRKNREGEDWKNIGMLYNGVLGSFQELPPPLLFSLGKADYSTYIK